MRSLLDECVPRPLKREFKGHQVRTVRDMGWSGKRNGALLKLMDKAGFAAFITVDQNLGYQQDLNNCHVAVIVLVAVSNKLDDLLPLMPSVRAALTTIQAGDYVEIDA
jgi:hypothetical protein